MPQGKAGWKVYENQDCYSAELNAGSTSQHVATAISTFILFKKIDNPNQIAFAHW